jgi:hypothetical protein
MRFHQKPATGGASRVSWVVLTIGLGTATLGAPSVGGAAPPEGTPLPIPMQMPSKRIDPTAPTVPDAPLVPVAPTASPPITAPPIAPSPTTPTPTPTQTAGPVAIPEYPAMQPNNGSTPHRMKSILSRLTRDGAPTTPGTTNAVPASSPDFVTPPRTQSNTRPLLRLINRGEREK